MDHLNAVQRALIEKLKAEWPQALFGGRVMMTTDTDYSEDGKEIAKQEVLPIAYLAGPFWSRNPVFTTNQKPWKYDPTAPKLPDGVTPSKFITYTAEDSVDLEYQITILAKKTDIFTECATFVYAYFMNGKTVTAEKNPGTPGDGSNTYEIDLIQKFQTGRIVNRSNLKETTGRIVIRGVQVSDGGIFKKGYVAEDVNVDITNK